MLRVIPSRSGSIFLRKSPPSALIPFPLPYRSFSLRLMLRLCCCSCFRIFAGVGKKSFATCSTVSRVDASVSLSPILRFHTSALRSSLAVSRCSNGIFLASSRKCFSQASTRAQDGSGMLSGRAFSMVSLSSDNVFWILCATSGVGSLVRKANGERMNAW